MKNKSKKNNKGFTLIELLAVVVILLSISVMAISSISAAIERNKTKQNNAKKDVLVSYARLYFEEHRNSVVRDKCSGNTCTILVSNLDLSEEEGKDADGKPFDGCIKLTIDDNKRVINKAEYKEKNDC